ncbi:MAG: major capsid protein [Planctomycetota bacterium]
MAKTLQQIIGGRNLTGLIQGVTPGLNSGKLPPALFANPVRRTVKGNTAKYKQVNGTRKTARIQQYGSPSEKRSLSGVQDKPVVLLHTFEHINHAASVLINLQSTNGDDQRMGQEEVDRQTTEFAQLFTNLRLAAMFSAFGLGAIHFDSDGNMLPSATGAAVTVDFEIPAGNKDQLNVLGAGNIIDASWATATTAIIRHVQKIQEAAIKKTGYPIVHAIYGANILDYLLNNNQTKELINRSQNNNAGASRASIPDGFMGLTWWPGYEGMFFEDQNGTAQSLIGDDTIVFLPEPDRTWFEVLEGTFAVPQNLNITSDGGAALASLAEVAGPFSYAETQTDPVSVKQMAGDTFLPVIKVPNAVMIADVAP